MLSRRKRDMPKSSGMPVDWWFLKKIKKPLPLTLLSLFRRTWPQGRSPGTLAVLMGYKAKARLRGEYIKDEVTQVLVKGKEVSGSLASRSRSFFQGRCQLRRSLGSLVAGSAVFRSLCSR